MNQEDGSGNVRLERQVRRDELLFAALLFNRHNPMAPHLSQAITARLAYRTHAQLVQMPRSGDA